MILVSYKTIPQTVEVYFKYFRINTNDILSIIGEIIDTASNVLLRLKF